MKKSKKPERYAKEEKVKIVKEPIRHSTNTNSPVTHIERKPMKQMLSDRGVY